MRALTIFLSKLLGLYVLLISLVILIQRPLMLETVAALMHDRPALLILGATALIAGLAIVISHNIWTGGVLPVVITVIGWLLLLRGVTLLAFTPAALGEMLGDLHFVQLYYVYGCVDLIIGLYLTYAGFTAKK